MQACSRSHEILITEAAAQDKDTVSLLQQQATEPCQLDLKGLDQPVKVDRLWY